MITFNAIKHFNFKKMKKVLILCMLITSVISYAQDNLAQATIKQVLAGNQDQVIQLAEAFSEDQYDWRPAEGVNSVREALLHVAGANYYLALKMGFPPPITHPLKI